jgi:hypothetical protein
MLLENLKIRRILSNFQILINYLRYIPFSGNPSPLSKRRLIAKLGLICECPSIIETGTYLGQSTKYFSKKFKNVYSIEISEKLHKSSKEYLAGLSNVHLFLGDTIYNLPRILDDLEEPAVLFLDAHASGGVTFHGDEPSPIRKELEIISTFKFMKDSIIIIDDARGFNGTNSYPAFEEICQWAEANDLNQPYVRLDMIIVNSDE